MRVRVLARDCVGTCLRGLDWPGAKTKKKHNAKKKKKIVKIIEKMCVCLHDTFLEFFFVIFFFWLKKGITRVRVWAWLEIV